MPRPAPDRSTILGVTPPFATPAAAATKVAPPPQRRTRSKAAASPAIHLLIAVCVLVALRYLLF
jgi:hypothetical protein